MTKEAAAAPLFRHHRRHHRIALLATALTFIVHFAEGLLTGEHVCYDKQSYTVNVTTQVPKNVTERTYVWCMQVPPRCAKYVTKTIIEEIIVEQEKVKLVEKCCDGYAPNNATNVCEIFCPENCNKGKCTQDGCRCDPGFTGKYCNQSCKFNKWGPGCVYDCLCQKGACSSRTGSCICPSGYAGQRCEIYLEEYKEERKTPTDRNETVAKKSPSLTKYYSFDFTTTTVTTPPFTTSDNYFYEEINENTMQDDTTNNNNSNAKTMLVSNIGVAVGVSGLIIAIAILIIIVVTERRKRGRTGRNAATSANRNGKMSSADKNKKSTAAAASTTTTSVSVITRSTFHTPLSTTTNVPDMCFPVFENPVFTTPLVEVPSPKTKQQHSEFDFVQDKSSRISTHVICSMDVYRNGAGDNVAPCDSLYDHPPSRISAYKRASSTSSAALAPEDFENDDSNNDPIYDEIPCWKVPVAAVANGNCGAGPNFTLPKLGTFTAAANCNDANNYMNVYKNV